LYVEHNGNKAAVPGRCAHKHEKELEMSDEIDIPPSAWDIKAIFPTRPGDDIVAEIKAYVKASGTPYLWRGHTHSPPAKDAQVVYLDEISLPRSHCGEVNRLKWSPCPVCSPRHPKFYKAGMIAWFPEEYTIRIIGPECFASFNLEGHTAAYKDFQREQQQKKNEAFLLKPASLLAAQVISNWVCHC
jgi:hypothetical protein